MIDRCRGKRDCGHWEKLRAFRRKLEAAQNHPIYVARNNEQPLLQQLLAADPPKGGMAAYLADLNHGN